MENMVDTTEAEYLAKGQRQVEDLIAIGLYRIRANRVKERVRQLYKTYENYLKPIEEVRGILAREIPEERSLSRDVIELRRMETH